MKFDIEKMTLEEKKELQGKLNQSIYRDRSRNKATLVLVSAFGLNEGSFRISESKQIENCVLKQLALFHDCHPDEYIKIQKVEVNNENINQYLELGDEYR